MTHRMWLVGLLLALATAAGPAAAQPKADAKKGAASNLGAVVAALSGTDVEVAEPAARVLGEPTAPEAHDALLEPHAIGLPAPVPTQALDALAAHPAPPDVVALKRYAGHHNPAVRSAALGALAVYPDPAARAA